MGLLTRNLELPQISEPEAIWLLDIGFALTVTVKFIVCHFLENFKLLGFTVMVTPGGALMLALKTEEACPT